MKVTQDQLDRLQLVASPADKKWDLSPNDRDAIRALLLTYDMQCLELQILRATPVVTMTYSR